MQAGTGAQRDPRLLQARRGLTRAERRRVGRLVGTGEAAWGEPSARYAVAVARARANIPQPFGPRTTRILYGAMSLVFTLDGIGAVRHDDHRVFGAYQIVLGVLFGYLTATNANAPGQARASLRRNKALLAHFPNDALAVPVPEPPSRTRQAVGMVLVILLYGTGGALGVWIAGGFSHEDLSNALLVGFLMGSAFLVLMRLINRRERTRKRRRDSPTHLH